ncbi:MAG: tol-pal system protein YbgF [Pseudomonadota bacterium]
MRAIFVALAAMLATSAFAQTDAERAQTLADIRQELSVLYVDIQRLKRELSTTGAPVGTTATGDSVLDRVAAIESELQRLTAQTEQLDFRINQIVTDGTNRIGDLEFRLVELEGGDISQLGQTTTLGGDVTPTPSPATPTPPATELAVGEQADFDAATQALNAASYADADQLFAAFVEAYPGSPLTAEAELGRGVALKNMGDTREAARAYLRSFSAAPNGSTAPTALVELGTALGALGQTREACLTLGEVEVRFPTASQVADAQAERTALECG